MKFVSSYEPESTEERFVNALMRQALAKTNHVDFRSVLVLGIPPRLVKIREPRIPEVTSSTPWIIEKNKGGSGPRGKVIKITLLVEFQVNGYDSPGWQIRASVVPEVLAYRKLFAWYGDAFIYIFDHDTFSLTRST